MIIPLIIAAVDTRPEWGQILLSCCPGRADQDHDLDHDIGVLKRHKVAAVITLNALEELDEMGVGYLGRAVHGAGMEWFYLPIEDYCRPDADWERDWLMTGPQIRGMIRDGKNIHIHCRAGCGRSGTLVARLLVELGICDPEEAIRRTRFARPCAIERPEQEDVVREARPIH
ncbi:MAG TPA: dual specificity protein phosphatase family protein [Beijerinckiaceae bacterium]|nr:dual specificity protein phosphatase family protein [Beijerinckiaceae bacterium]